MLRGPKYKLCRRLGSPVFEKCQTQKFVMSQARRGKSTKRPKQLSDYGLQMLEKQKIRFTYGLSEKQFSNYVKKASVKKGTDASSSLQNMLESRLDNIVYRLGIASTRALARQIVAHGHMMVNGKRTTSPSYQIKVGDTVSVREGSKAKGPFQDMEKKLKTYTMPKWLTFDPQALTAKISTGPTLDNTFLNFHSVLEFYTR